MAKFRFNGRNIFLEGFNGFVNTPIERIDDTFEFGESSQWRFSRSRDNHQYTPGRRVNYYGKCENNLIVSKDRDVDLKNVENAFIYSMGSQIKIVSITDFERILEIGKSLIQIVHGKLQYDIPNRIRSREDPPPLDPKVVREELLSAYNLSVRKISPISPKNSPHRTYTVTTDQGEKYVLKNWGGGEKELELLGQISEKLPAFFPKIVSPERKFSTYGINIGEGFYLLEQFVGGSPIESEYFLKGLNIARLHLELGRVFEAYPDLKKRLKNIDRGINESTLLSLYFDLFFSGLDHSRQLGHLEDIILKNIPGRLRRMYPRVTHGDLNASNMLWLGGRPKIIDLETLAISPRVNDLVHPITFLGNNQRARYQEGSTTNLLEGYNKDSKDPLSQEETETLFDLIKISLLKSYTIQNIRRSLGDGSYSEETNTLLGRVEEERLR